MPADCTTVGPRSGAAASLSMRLAAASGERHVFPEQTRRMFMAENYPESWRHRTGSTPEFLSRNGAFAYHPWQRAGAIDKRRGRNVAQGAAIQHEQLARRDRLGKELFDPFRSRSGRPPGVVGGRGRERPGENAQPPGYPP